LVDAAVFEPIVVPDGSTNRTLGCSVAEVGVTLTVIV
jgi:hypothetical protein